MLPTSPIRRRDARVFWPGPFPRNRSTAKALRHTNSTFRPLDVRLVSGAVRKQPPGTLSYRKLPSLGLVLLQVLVLYLWNKHGCFWRIASRQNKQRKFQSFWKNRENIRVPRFPGYSTNRYFPHPSYRAWKIYIIEAYRQLFHPATTHMRWILLKSMRTVLVISWYNVMTSIGRRPDFCTSFQYGTFSLGH